MRASEREEGIILSGADRNGEGERSSRIERALSRLSRRARLPLHAPDTAWHPGIERDLADFDPQWLAGGRTDGLASAVAYLAVLHLWNDGLDAAHGLVEKLETPTGMLVHGIVHRRGGDYGNANDWFRLAGHHPCYHGLQARAGAYLRQLPAGRDPLGDAITKIASQGSWNPYLFSGAVAIHESRVDREDSTIWLERGQRLELDAVLRYLEGNLAAFRES